MKKHLISEDRWYTTQSHKVAALCISLFRQMFGIFANRTGRTGIKKLVCCLEEIGRSFQRVNHSTEVPWCTVSSYGANILGPFAVQAGVACVCIS